MRIKCPVQPPDAEDPARPVVWEGWGAQSRRPDPILANAVRNAVRYAGAAGSISLSAVPAPDAPEAEILLTVADQGPGVPDDALHRLFDPFFRPEAARTRETGGTGLGLAIVKSRVEACGGSVSTRNRTVAGLALVFRLPRAGPTS